MRRPPHILDAIHSPRSPFRVWVAATVAIFLCEFAWGFASPLFVGADEPAQITKAAAVVRGELRGTPVAPGNANTTVAVPAAYANSWLDPFCYVLRPDATPSCLGPIPSDPSDAHRLVSAKTYVGRYPPLYYLLVGWPSWWLASASGIDAMRMASGLLTAAALGLAFALATTSRLSNGRRRRALGIGVALAATPVVLFSGAVVNPSGLEISAAIALWTCLARLARDTGPPARFLVVSTTVSASVCCAMRGLSPLWVVLAGAAGALFAGRHRVAELARCRDVRVGTSVVAVVVALSVAWIAWAGSLDLMGVRCTRSCPGFWDRASTVFGMTGTYLLQLVGKFGWVTTRGDSTVFANAAAPFTFAVWGATTVVLVAVSLRSAFLRSTPSPAPPREGLAVVGALVATVAIPVVIQGSEANSLGFVWQGRYILPVAVGVPILAAAIWERFHIPRALAMSSFVLAWLAQLAAFWWPLRRYSVGASGPLWFIGHARWAPPVPSLLLTGVFASALAGLYLWAYRRVFRPAATDSGDDLGNDITRERAAGVPVSLAGAE